MASFAPVASMAPADTVASVDPADAVASVAPADTVTAPTDAIASVAPADIVASSPTAAKDGCAAPATQIERSGGSMEMALTLLDICDTHLGGSRPTMLEDAVHSANSKYTDGDLTPS